MACIQVSVLFLKSNKWQRITLALIVVEAVIWTFSGLFRHWGYMTSINDLGSFDQAVWRAANGYSLINTSTFSQPVFWLGFHFQPILYLFVPVYKLFPSVNWLIVTQSIALPLAAWPIFRLAEQVTKSAGAAFIWAAAYLCNPFVLNAAAWDFHLASIAVPFFALALLAVEQKRPLLLLGSCLVVMTCKEHFGLAVAGFGLLYWIRHKNWLTGLSLFLTGVTAMAVIVGVVMPSLSPVGKQVMLSSDLGHMSRYSWLGGSIHEIIITLVCNPLVVLQRVFLDMGGLEYLCFLLLPFLFFPLAAPCWLLPAAADLSANLLSTIQMPRSIFAYHSVAIIPVLVIAAIHGCNKMTWFRKRYSLIELSGLVLLINLGLGYLFAPFPLPGTANYWQAVRPFVFYDKREALVQEIIKKGSISVQANIGAHFSQRTDLYCYPQHVGDVDFIVLRLGSPTKRLVPLEPGPIGTLAHHLQMNPMEYLDSVEELLHDEHYSVLLWDSPWLVLGRNQPSIEMTESISKRIEELRNKWQKNEGNKI